MIRGWLGAAALGLLLPAAAAAEGPGWTDVAMPAHGGFVLSLSVPPDWVYGYYGANAAAADAPQELIVSLHHPDHQPVRLVMRPYPAPRELITQVDGDARLTRRDDTLLNMGFDTSFGRLSFSRTDAYEAGSNEPYFRRALTLFHDRAGVEASFSSPPPGFAALARTFERIIESVAVTAAADLGADPPPQLYVSPKVTVTPGKNWLDAQFSLAMAPGWEAAARAVVDGGAGGAKVGRIVVDFLPPGPPGDARFTVHLEGYAYDERLSAEQFLATGEAILADLATDIEEQATEWDAGLPEDREQFRPGWYIVQDGFCLSRSTTRRFRKSGRIALGTYAGKDSVTGDDVKLRVYSAGGVTLACNLVFAAPAAEFDRLLPQVDRMVRSVKVEAGGLIMLK